MWHALVSMGFDFYARRHELSTICFAFITQNIDLRSNNKGRGEIGEIRCVDRR